MNEGFEDNDVTEEGGGDEFEMQGDDFEVDDGENGTDSDELSDDENENVEVKFLIDSFLIKC
jgi:hypothetical protein